MNQYIKRNKAHFFRALVCILISNALAVVLQFYKGDLCCAQGPLSDPDRLSPDLSGRMWGSGADMYT